MDISPVLIALSILLPITFLGFVFLGIAALKQIDAERYRGPEGWWLAGGITVVVGALGTCMAFPPATLGFGLLTGFLGLGYAGYLGFLAFKTLPRVIRRYTRHLREAA